MILTSTETLSQDSGIGSQSDTLSQGRDSTIGSQEPQRDEESKVNPQQPIVESGGNTTSASDNLDDSFEETG